jgi:glycosyltransferase involved in cell wall biosynthesis
MADLPTRVLIESTSTYETRFTTGIQRVVRNIVRESLSGKHGPHIECLPVVFRGCRFYDATKRWRRLLSQPKRQSTRPRRESRPQSVASRIRKLFRSRTLRRVLANLFWRVSGRSIVFSKNDVLLLLDETWNLSLWAAVEKARENGARVVGVVYDLIPLDFPHFFKPPFPQTFADWLSTMTDHAVSLLAISETVRSRLVAYLDGQGKRDKQVATFRLGADLPQQLEVGSVRPDLRRVFEENERGRTYLVVGTVEPRKNHSYVLDAFDQLWRQHPSVRLCIVGREGWDCQEIVNRVRKHAQLDSELFWFDNLNDSELQFCYENASALIAASHAEGFGLPIVEAQLHGLPVLASDIPVHREVGGTRCIYFDIDSPVHLHAELSALECGRAEVSPSSIDTDSVITWSEICRDLLGRMPCVPSRRYAP